MKKLQRSILLTFIVFSIVFTLCVSHSYAFDIDIDVSPNILNLQSASPSFVTVHLDIAYSAVDGKTVFLNGVPIVYAKSDLRGDFVAKFSAVAIKALDSLEIGVNNTMTLTGFTTDNDPVEFVGIQDIMVIDSIPQGPQGKN